PEIRVLQELRRLNSDRLSVDALKAIKHPSGGGGEGPAVALVAKGFLVADGDGFAVTQKGRDFLAIEAKPEFEETGSGAANPAVDAG
ncbi:MAG TPA: hypothetical protein VFO89_04210, partial [Thermoanaerobaculia bacterium]|nr:hypothetical protein [Thermoanaerobaculia bacterium]